LPTEKVEVEEKACAEVNLHAIGMFKDPYHVRRVGEPTRSRSDELSRRI
jgi:hypothetical protein